MGTVGYITTGVFVVFMSIMFVIEMRTPREAADPFLSSTIRTYSIELIRPDGVIQVKKMFESRRLIRQEKVGIVEIHGIFARKLIVAVPGGWYADIKEVGSRKVK